MFSFGALNIHKPLTMSQFFLRTADADVEKYLKLLTFMPLNEIHDVIEEHEKDQSKRVAQHKLAQEFVELIYGVEAAEKAESEHRQLFNKNISISDLKASVADAASANQRQEFIHPAVNKHAKPLRREDNDPIHAKLPVSLVHGKRLNTVLRDAGMVTSATEGQRLINAGGVYVGGKSDAKSAMDDNVSYTPLKSGFWKEYQPFIVDDNLLVVRVGKWRVKIISIVPDGEYEELGLTCPGWEEVKRAAAEPAPIAKET